MLKSSARKIFLEKRKNLTNKEILIWDDLILIQFQKLNLKAISCIANFYPMEKNKEPNTLLLVEYLKAMIPNLQIVYPVVDTSQSNINFYKESEKLQQNNWGIYEPVASEKVEPLSIDAILVPLIGFDLKGNRIGYGKGFYDKFFENYPKHRPRIGVSYFEPISKIEDTHEFDVPLTHCITPWNHYEF